MRLYSARFQLENSRFYHEWASQGEGRPKSYVCVDFGSALRLIRVWPRRFALGHAPGELQRESRGGWRRSPINYVNKRFLRRLCPRRKRKIRSRKGEGKKSQEASNKRQKTCIITQFCTVASNPLFIMAKRWCWTQLEVAFASSRGTRCCLLLFNDSRSEHGRKITAISLIIEFKDSTWGCFCLLNGLFCCSTLACLILLSFCIPTEENEEFDSTERAGETCDWVTTCNGSSGSAFSFT